MESWQTDVIKIVVPAVIAGVGGWWVHVRWNREERIKAELREDQRQAEYEEFKNRRRLIGAGDVEKMERADRLTDLINSFFVAYRRTSSVTLYLVST